MARFWAGAWRGYFAVLAVTLGAQGPAVALAARSPPAAGSTFPTAYVSPADGDVWVRLSPDAAPLRVTTDNRQKSAPKISPDGTRFIFDGRCCRRAGDEAAVGKWDEVVVVAWPNHILWRTVELMPAPKPGVQSRCAAIDTLEWIDNDRFAVSCMESPSALDYGVVSISQRKPIAHYLGLDFVWSQDKRHVAHLGNIVHFAAPEFQSNCLMIDGQTVSRPQCDGTGHGRSDVPGVVPNIESIGDITWSPDSRHVAYIDGMADWHGQDDPHDIEGRLGEFGATRSYLAVTQPGGFARGWAIKCERDVSFRWLDAGRLRLTCGKTGRVYDFGHGHPGTLP